MSLQFAAADPAAIPVWFATRSTWPDIAARLPAAAASYARASGFEGKAGRHCVAPDGKGDIAAVLFGLEDGEDPRDAFLPGRLPGLLPPGVYRFANAPHDAPLAALAWLLGSYRFLGYLAAGKAAPTLVAPKGVDAGRVEIIAQSVALVATSSTRRPTTWGRRRWPPPR